MWAPLSRDLRDTSAQERELDATPPMSLQAVCVANRINSPIWSGGCQLTRTRDSWSFYVDTIILGSKNDWHDLKASESVA